MQYYSIDIETTGLNVRKDEILEIAVICDDLSRPFSEAKRLRVVFVKESLRYKVTPFIMNMHKALFAEIENHVRNGDCVDGTEYLYYPTDFDSLIHDCFDLETDCKITAAGKNVESFDIPFIKRFCSLYSFDFRHRSIDPAVFFMEPEDEIVPDTATCCDRAEIKIDESQAHTAMYDAEIVCQLIRTHYGL